MEPTPTKVSAAFFCPQNKPPKPAYLDSIRRYLKNNAILAPFRDAVLNLPSTWDLFAQENVDISQMTQGSQYAQKFHNWIAFDGGSSQKVDMEWSEIMSGLISLPLLTIMQTVQYFQYLQVRRIGHAQFLEEVRVGGVQGYCAGLLPAFAIATARDEKEVARNASIALRLSVGIGAYGELGDDENVPGPTTVVLRTKYTGQAEEIVSKFPRTYISAITDPETISVVGPSKVIEDVRQYAESQGITATKLHLRGKIHNPENDSVCKDLMRICEKYPDLLLLPSSAELRAPVNSNMTGRGVEETDSLSKEILRSTLVSRCEWHSLLTSMAGELQNTGNDNHTFVLFGTGRKNCVPTKAFEEKKLHTTKLDVMAYVEQLDIPRDGRPLDQFPSNAVAIVGAGCRLPGANSIDELWELLENGIQRVEKLPVSRFDAESISRGTIGSDAKPKENKTIYGNFLDDVESFDNNFFGVSPREATYMDPQQRLLLETAYEALDASGYLRTHRREDFDNVGCFIGASYTEYLENTSSYNPTAYTATGTIRAFQCGKISYHFGWSGPSEVIDTACSASLVAVNRACKAIQSGECPMALAGGVNLITGINNYFDLGKAGFLSPTGQCKPFDSSADGYCRADGVGLVALKSLSQAVADGNHVLGVILGVSTNQGGLSPAITVPYSRAQVSLFKNVTNQSGLEPSEISYVEAHGTGTQVGDPIEISSVREVFGGPQRHDYVNLGSLKANVGHSETAAGIGSLMKVLAMIKHGKIPALAGFKSLNPKIPALEPDFLRIPTEVVPWDVSFRAACVNSYGAAGSNSALICSEAPTFSQQPAAEYKETPATDYPICITGACNDSLKSNALKLAEYIRKNAGKVKIADLAFTLYDRRKHHNVQWVGNANNVESLAQSLELATENIFEVPRCPKSVVLTFSGQSKETIGLNKSFYDAFPRLQYYIHQCDSILLSLGYSSILSALFTSDVITDVVALQCGTFAVQYASAMCWIDSGLPVQAVVGHSFGELTAMAVSGILSLEDALKLISFRASLMQTKWGPERGTMLAVEATSETVRKMIAVTDATLEIACFNGNKNHVLVGSLVDIEKAEKTIAADVQFKGIRSTRVKTSHGFHSLFTQPILQDLDIVSQGLNFKATTLPFEACTEKTLEEISSSRIVQHTRAPVFFGAAIARLEQRLGPCIWLEAGSDSPIINMTKRAVQDPSKHTFLSLKTQDDANASAVVSSTTASLWREGVSTLFWGFLSTQELGIKQIWLPPYQFQRTRHWLQYRDPVTEERRVMTSPSSMDRSVPRATIPRKLVTARSRDSKSWSSLEFNIDIETGRFTDIVSGHAVRDKPLCPASMYMECVVMAAQMIEPGISVKSLKFQNISFQGALGLNYNKDVTLQLDGEGDYLTWNFTVRSVARNSNGRHTTHSKGRFSVTSMVDFQLYERMISDRINDILVNPQSERLMAGRAYTLFSRVVNYSDALRGISEITILDNRHAVAEIRRPKKSVSRMESTAVEVCDTVTLDTFIQVVGLLINSSDRCPADEVFIATNIDSIIMQNCEFTETESWTVYAMATARNESNVAGDMFVFTEGKLVFTGSGVQFTRLPIAKLEKLLDGIGMSTSTKPNEKTTLQRNESHGHGLAGLPIENGITHKPSFDTLDERTLVDPEILPRHPSLKSVMIKNDERLSTLGLDSISKIEFFNKIQSEVDRETTKSNVSRIGALYDKFSAIENKSANIEETEIFSSSPDSAKTAGTHSKMRTKQRILEMIADNSGQSTGTIGDETILQDIGIDSLSVVELKESFENGFGVSFGDWDFGLHLTVGDILEFVESQL
ncbi:Conidial yellow pigment biosynthesis polyketide synthase [Talaromyces islandicus]|uniref:Conidial yellow pigment biosynthesis polyketide synthase n=1 Tax=Talaromyces islandicus TaxID=28573 RepID=A0A0U1M853_TALIS|nr:Conidial yellow pigment biosynthesis polyketide synthase [Talaromyces islandicus]